jgi:hypothetical protein
MIIVQILVFVNETIMVIYKEISNVDSVKPTATQHLLFEG